ncbi:MAG: SGNH/GDSL hydrolase family protein [Bacillus sp. (in: Bacteria)]|uniref:SGNH/GDSL hydrolase family protein n=1 Tax=Niallia alba TaxID=2729105 RepID=A0A7Y0K6D8_9BACI|nr:SGNH/GDSL hydrolase family protein [Niallia alba]MBQ6446380.1 SGNH/GDSL hydrolase family protein [Bacillus sp. (in: firmicutes)]NMO76626.1 SGNH/GDSL hydrolase family protein [Niallia alba]
MRKNLTVSILTLSSIVCLLWIIGLGWVLVDYTNQPAEKPQTTNTENQKEIKADGVHLLALGDSLTRGTGDDTGKGYIGYLKEALAEKTEEEIKITNYGIKGLTTDKLAEQLTGQEIQRQTANADLLFITIGGNDLFQGGQSLTEIEEDSISKLMEAYSKQLQTVLTTIRSINADAPIYLMGLYNPFNDLDNRALTSQVVRTWNNTTAEICANYAQTIFVPTYDIFQQNVQQYLYSDHFHPNKKGYQLMAERVASLISWEVNDNE